MQTSFTVHGQSYQATLEKSAKSEEDKFQPYRVTVSGKGNSVTGILQVTDSLLAIADSDASRFAEACGRSLASEIYIRDLEPDFSFVVDHRWVAAS